MILLNERVEKVQTEVFKQTTNSIIPSWSSSVAVAKKPGFFNRLAFFAKDGITDEQCELV
jgi:hypothetical protein